MKFTIFTIISLFSWVLLVATALASYGRPEEYVYVVYGLEFRFKEFWMTFSYSINTFNSYTFLLPYPLLMIYGFFYFCFTALIALSVISCCVMFFGQFKTDYLQGMYEPFERFHFIPVLCASALFITGESKDP